MAAQTLKSARLAFKVAKSALTKVINMLEENGKILDKHNDAAKSTKLRLVAG